MTSLSLEHLFDYKEILKNTPDKDKLSVTLKKGNKGVSLFAIKDIKKDNLIAYYKMKVYLNRKKGDKSYDESNTIEELEKIYKKDIVKLPKREDKTEKEYKKILLKDINATYYINGKERIFFPPKSDMYHFTVCNKNGYDYKKFTGDLYKGSLPKPKRNIPYWAYFSNEPSITENPNSYIDVQSFENFKAKNRTTLKEGDTITYALFASHDIKKGEEILWCYGDNYDRNYKISKSCNK